MFSKIKSRKNKRISSSRKNKKSNKVFRAGSYSISSSKRKSRKVKKSRKKKTILQGVVRKSKLQSSSNFGPKRSKLNKNNINYNLQGGNIYNKIMNKKGGIKYVYDNKESYKPVRDEDIEDRVVQMMHTQSADKVLVLFDSGDIKKITYDDILEASDDPSKSSTPTPPPTPPPPPPPLLPPFVPGFPFGIKELEGTEEEPDLASVKKVYGTLKKNSDQDKLHELDDNAINDLNNLEENEKDFLKWLKKNYTFDENDQVSDKIKKK